VQHRASRNARGRHRRTTPLHSHRAPSTPVAEKGRYVVAAALVAGVGVAGVATSGAASGPRAGKNGPTAAQVALAPNPAAPTPSGPASPSTAPAGTSFSSPAASPSPSLAPSPSTSTAKPGIGSEGTDSTGAAGTESTGSVGTGSTGPLGTESTGSAGTGSTGSVGTGSTGTVGTGSTGTVGTGSTGSVGTGSTGSVGTGSTGAVGTGSTAAGTGSVSSLGTRPAGSLGIGSTGSVGTGSISSLGTESAGIGFVGSLRIGSAGAALSFVPQARKVKPLPLWVNPLPEAATTSCFGLRWGRLHAGVDLAAPDGTRIRAAGAGTVVAAGPAEGYGNAVLIDHGNGYLTHYGHMSAITVTLGQHVVAGDQIGNEGSTGHSTGPHLHFEVHQGSYQNPIEPTAWMHEHGVDITGCPAVGPHRP